ncbi:MAG: hypothetical protein WED07_08615 [Candidatus Freyarchaeum deiterrae]
MKNTPTPMWSLTHTITVQQSTSKGLIVVWGNETRVNTNTTNDQASLSLRSRSDGSFVIAWHSNQTGDLDVYFKIFDSTGNNLTEDIRVNGNTSNNQANPSLSTRSNGSFVVAWDSNQTGNADVYFKLFNSAGDNTTDDVRVNGYTANRQNFASVYCFDNDGFVVAWEGAGQIDDDSVYIKVFDSTGNNLTDDIQVNTETAFEQENANVCCVGNESFVVVWDNQDVYNWWDVYFKIFDSSGNNQTNDILAPVNIEYSQNHATVYCFSNGAFVMAWESPDGSAEGVYTRLFNSAGNALTGDIQVNTYTSAHQRMPSVCCFSNNSGYIVVWSSWLQEGYGEANDGIYCRVFNSMGQSFTDEVHVNEYINDRQEYPSVQCLENGSFVVAWESLGQDGSGLGVYFRVGNLSSASISPLPLLAMVLGQSGTGLSLPLLIGGGLLAAVVVLGTIVFLRSRRGT